MANPLPALGSFCFPPTHMDAINTQRKALCGTGQGHNATTLDFCPVVPSVVGYLEAKSSAYAQPTTPQRENASLVCVCMCARARARDVPFYRCGVVLYSYLIEKKEEKATTYPTTQGVFAVVVVVVALWVLSKSLKSNKIIGIYCHGG